eukprot:scaffold285_cov304-Pinguiococcus_pyrenoidosus.AAC.37
MTRVLALRPFTGRWFRRQQRRVQLGVIRLHGSPTPVVRHVLREGELLAAVHFAIRQHKQHRPFGHHRCERQERQRRRELDEEVVEAESLQLPRLDRVHANAMHVPHVPPGRVDVEDLPEVLVGAVLLNLHLVGVPRAVHGQLPVSAIRVVDAHDDGHPRVAVHLSGPALGVQRHAARAEEHVQGDEVQAGGRRVGVDVAGGGAMRSFAPAIRLPVELLAEGSVALLANSDHPNHVCRFLLDAKLRHRQVVVKEQCELLHCRRIVRGRHTGRVVRVLEGIAAIQRPHQRTAVGTVLNGAGSRLPILCVAYPKRSSGGLGSRGQLFLTASEPISTLVGGIPCCDPPTCDARPHHRAVVSEDAQVRLVVEGTRVLLPAVVQGALRAIGRARDGRKHGGAVVLEVQKAARRLGGRLQRKSHHASGVMLLQVQALIAQLVDRDVERHQRDKEPLQSPQALIPDQRDLGSSIGWRAKCGRCP